MVVNDSTWKVLFVEYGITYITHFIVVSNTDLQWQNTGKNLMIVFTSVFTSFIEITFIEVHWFIFLILSIYLVSLPKKLKIYLKRKCPNGI